VSYTHRLDLTIEVSRSAAKDAADLTTRQIIDAAQSQLDLIREAAIENGTLDKAGHYDPGFNLSETELEDVWIVRAISAPGTIHRDIGARMANHTHTLRPPDVRPVNAAGLSITDIVPGPLARANWRHDAEAVYVRPERLNDHLIVADLHDEAGAPAGVIDLDDWIEDLRRMEAELFLRNPDSDYFRQSIVAHASTTHDPNLRISAAQDNLSVTFRDLPAVVDAICMRFSLTSDIGLENSL
jgi:hypothetical protein